VSESVTHPTRPEAVLWVQDNGRSHGARPVDAAKGVGPVAGLLGHSLTLRPSSSLEAGTPVSVRLDGRGPGRAWQRLLAELWGCWHGDRGAQAGRQRWARDPGTPWVPGHGNNLPPGRGDDALRILSALPLVSVARVRVGQRGARVAA
jgi:hypothetical protein